MNEQINTSLRELLLSQFNEEELTQLCADVGLNYAILPGEGAFGKTRAMLMTTQSNNKLYTLIARVRDLRPEAYAESQLPELLVNHPPEATAASGPAPAPRATSRAEATAATPDAAPAPKRDLRKIITLIAAIGLALLACMLLGDGLLGLLNGATAGPGAVSGGLPTLAPVTPAPLPSAIPPTAALTPGLPTAATSAPAPALTSAPAQPPAASPAAQRVLDLNQQLIAYYEGKVTADALTEFWTVEGAKEPVAFKDTTLPRVMQLSRPVAPGAVAASVKYVQNPVASAETADGAVVNTREFWKYINTASGQSGCETRDYVYTFVTEGGTLKAKDVSGKLVASGCAE